MPVEWLPMSDKYLSQFTRKKPETLRPRTERLDPTRQFFNSLLGGMEEGINRWMEFQNGLLNLTQAFVEQPTRDAMTRIGSELPRMATPAAILPFNQQCPGQRRLVWSEFSFAETYFMSEKIYQTKTRRNKIR